MMFQELATIRQKLQYQPLRGPLSVVRDYRSVLPVKRVAAQFWAFECVRARADSPLPS